YWSARPVRAAAVDPIFGRPLPFYLFTLPAWELVSAWLMTLALIICGIAVFFVVITGGAGALTGRRPDASSAAWRGLSVAFAAVLVMFAVRVFLGRFEQLFQEHTI